VTLRNDISQDPAANAQILVTWEYLDLTDFQAIRSLEQLDHADRHTIHLYD